MFVDCKGLHLHIVFINLTSIARQHNLFISFVTSIILSNETEIPYNGENKQVFQTDFISVVRYLVKAYSCLFSTMIFKLLCIAGKWKI